MTTKLVSTGVEFPDATTQTTSGVPLTGGTMTGDVSLGDNVKAKFGAGDDLQIYHDGSHSFISDQGTGNLLVLADNFEINSSSNTANKITATTGGAVTLFHNNAAKLATTSTGIDVTGTVTADGLTVGGSADINGRVDMQALTSSTSGYSSMTRTGTADTGAILELLSSNGSVLKASKNGDVSFYEDTGTTPKFFWDASAESLGIGTSSPTAPLTLESSGTSPAFVTFNGGTTADITSYSARAGLELISYRSDGGSPYTKTSAIIANADGTVPSEMQFWTKTNGQSSPAERMRITSAGNVGIGTTSPTGGVSVASATYLGAAATTGSKITLNSENTASWVGTRELISLESVGNGADHRTGSFSLKLKTNAADTSLQEYMYVNAVSGYTAFSTAGTERVRVNASGVDISAGNLKVDSGYGIDFSAATPDGTGTTGSEVLDDYEEGTWTPGVTTGTSTYSSATYTKVGRLVTLTLKNLRINDVTTAAAIIITGVPFTSSAATIAVGSAMLTKKDNNTYASLYIGGGAVTMYLAENNTSYISWLQHSGLNSATNDQQLTITYTV